MALSELLGLPGDIANTVERLNGNGDYYRADPGENEAAARMAGQLDRVYGNDKLEGKAVLGEGRKNIAENQQTGYNEAGGVTNGQAGIRKEDSKYRSDSDGWWNEQKSGTKLRTYDYPEGRFAETKASPEFWGKDAEGKPITLYHFRQSPLFFFWNRYIIDP